MAENEISDYFETDASNTDITGITVQENVMKPSNVNNAFRALQGALKRWYKTSLWRLRDATDQTKLLAFDLSGQAGSATRTQKTPNYNGTMKSQAQGAAIASGTTTDIGAASGSAVHITGTTTITGLGTADAGIERVVIFDGILTLTHNGTSLILPGAASIVTGAGDAALFVSEGTGNWRCVSYQKAANEGTYTPTGTAMVNCDSVTPLAAFWFRVGSRITVFGIVTVDFTLGAGTQSDFRLSLPVASNFGAISDAAGAGGNSSANAAPLYVSADTTNKAIFFRTFAPNTAANTYSFTASYRVI